MSPHFLLFRLLVPLTIVISVPWSTIRAAELTTLDGELQRVVRILRTSVEAGQSVRVEPFSDLTAGTNLSGSIKTGLSEAFVAECKRQKLTIDRAANFIVSGRFFVTEPERPGEPLVLKLDWDLRKRNGQTVVEIMPTRVETSLVVSDPTFLAQAVGLVGIVSSGNDVGSPNKAESVDDAATAVPKRVSDLALRPTGHIEENTFIKSAPTSQFAVEIRSRPANTDQEHQALPATIENGQPHVSIPAGHEYQIWIYNQSGAPVAVAPSIDGLSTFQFANASYRDPISGKLTRKHYVVEGNTSPNPQASIGVIRGWHFSDAEPNNVGRFLVSNYGDSAAASLGIPEGLDTGAIHLQFCRCVAANRGVRTRGISPKLATAVGSTETVRFQTSELLPGDVFEFLTIRYQR